MMFSMSTKLLRFSQGFMLGFSRRDARHILERTSYVIQDLHLSNSPCCKESNITMSKKKVLNYEQLLEAQKNKDILIIDVREQTEINKTGKLPGSIHIPMDDVSNVLQNLSEKDFKERYGKNKPSKNTKIILSCQAGRRSAIVQETIQQLGYENAYNYSGGWMDWESKQKSK